MKLHERFADKGYHTCIATTFGIDFDAFEGVVLPRLRGAGCNNNLVLMDARMMTHALESASILPSLAGRHYTLNGVASRGVFHPKIILQLGRTSGRLLVGSANLTAPGLGGNLEIGGLVSCGPDDMSAAGIIAAGWRYLNGLIDSTQEALAHQIEWARRRTPWLLDAVPLDDPLLLNDGGSAAFLVGSGAVGIGERFSELVGSRQVARLVAISPYWDPQLDALQHLAQVLGPQEVSILVGGLQPSFPSDALAVIKNVKLYDFGAMAENRFAHAKLMIAQTKEADHILFGSANCTVAALGKKGFGGINHEACLYRRMAPGTSISMLGLSYALSSESRINEGTLPAYAPKPEIPLEAALQRYPGRFEATADRVSWWPSPGFLRADSWALELMDEKGSPIPCELTLLSGDKDGCRKFVLSGTKVIPSFARIRIGSGCSAPAIVVVVDSIRGVSREARGRQEERIAGQLASETEEGLWLLEAFDLLADSEGHSEEPRIAPGEASRKRAGGRPDEPESTGQVLSYEEFVAGRKLRGGPVALGKSDFEGSELALVRHCLNRLIGVDSTDESALAAPEDELIRGALATEDDGADSPSDHVSDDALKVDPQADSRQAKDAIRAQAARKAATRESIGGAVVDFQESVVAKAQLVGLSHYDILRLRVMLMIVLAAARPVDETSTEGLRSIQVLNPKGDTSWPCLLGKVLFTYFGGRSPAVKNLAIREIHEEVPVDYLECWALCLWTANACRLALREIPSEHFLLARIDVLAGQIYVFSGVDSGQFGGEGIMRSYEALTRRFARALSLSPEDLLSLHKSAVKAFSVAV